MENLLYAAPLKKITEVLPQRYRPKRRAAKGKKDDQRSALSVNCSEVSMHKNLSNSLSSAKRSLPKGGDLTGMLTHMVTHLLCLYDKDREYYRILLPQMMFVPKNADSLLEKLLQEQLAFIAYLVELSKGKKRVSKEVDAYQAATSFFLIYIGVLVNFLSSPKMTVDDAAHIFSSSISLLHRGIENRGKKKDCQDLHV